MGNCGDRLEKCVICAGAHPASEHQCGVNRYNKEKRKLCIYVIAWCANCQGNHQANSAQYLLRLKAQIQACKDKAVKISGPPEKARSVMKEIRKEENPAASDLDMDVEGEEWAKSPIEEPSLEFGLKYRDHTQDC